MTPTRVGLTVAFYLVVVAVLGYFIMTRTPDPITVPIRTRPPAASR